MNSERTTVEDLRRLKALVTASTKIETASRLTREAAIEIINIPGISLSPSELREGLCTISDDLHAYFRRLSDAIGKLP